MKQLTDILLAGTTDAGLRKQIEFETANLGALINNISGVMWSVDRDYNLVTSNNAFDIMAEAMCGEKIQRGQSVLTKGFTRSQIDAFKQHYDRAFAGETFTVEEYNEPYYRWYDISFYPIRQGYDVVGTACSSHDITLRKKTMATLIEAQRHYAFTSEINQAIIYAKNEKEILDHVCRIAITTGKFRAAFFSRVEAGQRNLLLTNQANLIPQAVEQLACKQYEPYGLIATLIETGRSMVTNDTSVYSGTSPFWEWFAEQHNMRSSIIVPLNVGGEITYLLCLVSDKENFFNKEEVRLLEKSTENVAFALDKLEKERQRLAAEHKLMNEEKRQRHAEQIAHLGSWELDFSTGLATWSPEHCRIFGTPETNNIHDLESWLAFIHPDDLDYVMSQRREMEGGNPHSAYYYRIIRPDGSVRYIYRESQLHYNETGKATGVYGIALDVTEKRMAEEKLKHSAFRFNQAQAITHLGSWELNCATGISVWSQESCRIYGVPENENVHSYEFWESFLHPEDRLAVLAELGKLYAGQSSVAFVHRIVRPTGAVRYLHTQAFTERTNGELTGLYGTAHDITEQVARTEQLKAQNEKLKQIAWIQSHKVRGPLATILGLAQFFRDERPASEVSDIAQGILQSSEKLDMVIREIVNNTTVAEPNEPFHDLPGSTAAI